MPGGTPGLARLEGDADRDCEAGQTARCLPQRIRADDPESTTFQPVPSRPVAYANASRRSAFPSATALTSLNR